MNELCGCAILAEQWTAPSRCSAISHCSLNMGKEHVSKCRKCTPMRDLDRGCIMFETPYFEVHMHSSLNVSAWITQIYEEASSNQRFADGPTSIESRFSLVIMLLVRGSGWVPIACSSQTTEAPATLKISLVAAAISGPMPSPGNRVHRTGSPLAHRTDCWLSRYEV